MPIDGANALFDASPTPILLLTADGKVRSLNRAARRVLGIEADRIIGRPILARIVTEDRDLARDSFLRALEGQTCEWTMRFKRGDAAIRVQRVRAVSFGSAASEGLIMFSRDITESREGRPETLQLQTLLENLPGQFVAVLDTRQKIRYSSGLARLHFQDDLDAVGMAFQDLFSVEHDGAERLKEVAGAVAGGEHWTGVVWHQRTDGVSFPVRLFISPHLDPARGRIIGALVVGQDVTLEQNWRDRARTAEHFAALGKITTQIAGAFDTGLARASGATDDPEALRAELGKLSNLAGSIDDFAQVAHLQKESTSLREILMEGVKTLSAPLGADRVSVNLDGVEDLGPVSADPRTLRRAVEILLENALDNVRPQGSGRIRMAVSKDAHLVTVRITDSGPDIPDNILDRAFDPLFTTKPDGVGMGLSLARVIVQAHGGKLWAEREKDGVAFVFNLPIEQSPSAFRPTPLRIGRLRSVLVVDDEEPIRVSMRRFLERVGYEVREAWSGRSAIAQITAGHPPELVLTDLRMTDGSGSWLLDQLAEDFPDLLRRTVVITGDPDRPEIAATLKRIDCPVLTKPIDLPDLLEVLDEVALRD